MEMKDHKIILTFVFDAKEYFELKDEIVKIISEDYDLQEVKRRQCIPYFYLKKFRGELPD